MEKKNIQRFPPANVPSFVAHTAEKGGRKIKIESRDKESMITISFQEEKSGHKHVP